MMEETGFDVASRRLCPDGSCTGIIGPDGKCSECGQAASPSTLAAAGAPENDTPFAANEAPLFADARTDMSPDGGDVVTFDANRPLCPDGACVGVLGNDGRCGICGKTGRSS